MEPLGPKRDDLWICLEIIHSGLGLNVCRGLLCMWHPARLIPCACTWKTVWKRWVCTSTWSSTGSATKHIEANVHTVFPQIDSCQNFMEKHLEKHSLFVKTAFARNLASHLWLHSWMLLIFLCPCSSNLFEVSMISFAMSGFILSRHLKKRCFYAHE